MKAAVEHHGSYSFFNEAQVNLTVLARLEGLYPLVFLDFSRAALFYSLQHRFGISHIVNKDALERIRLGRNL